MLNRISKIINKINENKYCGSSSSDNMKKLLGNLASYENIEKGFSKIDTLKRLIKEALFLKYVEKKNDKYVITNKGATKYNSLYNEEE